MLQQDSQKPLLNGHSIFNVGFFDWLIFKSPRRLSDIVEHVNGVVIQQQVRLYIPLTQLSFILAWSTFQAHVFAGSNILNVGELASYPVVDGNIHLILQLLGLLLFALTLLIFLLGRQGCLFQNVFNFLDLLQGFNFLQEYLALGSG
ncbi:Hypothetical_protein [Hexamita inflata]|uniref:Hypothetical_protein n=1 Tax=Hexamita inflata TaxID=28002 RepID=A0AA86QDG5_9EUKA|nr:Hypothetical protein HINF_LOCUS44796 [Hexamita inflata]